MDECYHWIVNEFSPLNCQRPAGLAHRGTKCTCMNFLQEQESTEKAMQLAHYMIHFVSLERETRREVLHEWAKVSLVLKSLDGNIHSRQLWRTE